MMLLEGLKLCQKGIQPSKIFLRYGSIDRWSGEWVWLRVDVKYSRY